jgi:hypothetical protein
VVAATTTRPRPSFPSVSSKLPPAARPVVSTAFDRGDAHGDPSDEIIATFPPFITVIPQLFTPLSKSNRTNLILPLSQRPAILTTRPVAPPQLKPAEPNDKPKLVVPPVPVQIKPELPPFQIDGEVTTATVPPDYDEPVIAVTHPRVDPEHGVIAGVSPLAETPAPTFTRIDAEPTSAPEPGGNGVTESQRPLFVFTTPRRVIRQ